MKTPFSSLTQLYTDIPSNYISRLLEFSIDNMKAAREYNTCFYLASSFLNQDKNNNIKVASFTPIACVFEFSWKFSCTNITIITLIGNLYRTYPLAFPLEKKQRLGINDTAYILLTQNSTRKTIFSNSILKLAFTLLLLAQHMQKNILMHFLCIRVINRPHICLRI